MLVRWFTVLGEVSLASVGLMVGVTCQGALHIFQASSGGTEQSLLTTYSSIAEFFSASACGDVLSFCFCGRSGRKKGKVCGQAVGGTAE